ncbi:glycosyltransferase family 4 protein [Bradyrhizobium genosp. A]|uniref:glycosyltransferase family 4 protein n=1 Tax=Bradyrhizobium genosp. A TaxID=83626 RepID=UPI003CF1EAAE
MKILVIHNIYQETGGEDTVVDQEINLLKQRGHDVRTAFFDNSDIRNTGDRIRVALQVGRNGTSAARLSAMISTSRPDVVHVHNFFPLVSPGGLDVIAREGIPVVQTLHNFRTICPGGILMRDGQPCEACVGRNRWPAVRWRCYRGSAVGSAAAAYMGHVFRRILDRHRALITVVTMTQFAKSRFLADGFTEDQIVVRPNFAPDIGPGLPSRDGRLVYIGRLSEEKGADIVVKAAAKVRGEVEIVGDGPETDRLRSIAPPNVTFAGRIPREEVASRLRSASAVLVPSRCYEGFPMIVAESMACSTPVIASRIGALAEIVEDRKTGRLIATDDIDGWAHAMNEAIDDPGQLAQWGRSARQAYTLLCSEERGYDSLIGIYQRAIERARAA